MSDSFMPNAFWYNLRDYCKNKYAADTSRDNIDLSIVTDEYCQIFSIYFEKPDYSQNYAKEYQLEICTLLYGVNEANKKTCEEIVEEFKEFKIFLTKKMLFIARAQKDYLQTFIDIDENLTIESVDKILNKLCDVAQKIENKIKIDNQTQINKNVIYIYKKADFSEEKAKDFQLLEKANWYFDYQRWDPGFLCSFNPIKIAKRSSFEKKLFQYSADCSRAFFKFYRNSAGWIPVHYNFADLLPDDIWLIQAKKNEFLSRYKVFLKELPFIYANTIQEMNAKEENAHFFSVDELTKLRDSNKIQFLNTDKFEAGQIFIKHPFLPDTYINIETSETTLFHIKMQCLSRIMQCLGATSVSGHAYVSETKQRNMDADGHISYKVVDATGSLSTSQNDKYESDYVLEDTFSGDFTEESYAEALNEAKKVGLYNDFDIKNLLEQRNPNKKNEMKSRKVKIEMTRELNKSLDAAFALQAEGFEMNGNYKQILQTQRNVMFELNIKF